MTGRVPRLMGKPEPAMFHSALKRLNSTPDRTLMIGDRLDTDILGAQQAGLRTALVLTGISRAEDVNPIVPDGIYDSLATLHELWQEVVATRTQTG
jgi:4-nitrophenyl phosphatase